MRREEKRDLRARQGDKRWDEMTAREMEQVTRLRNGDEMRRGTRKGVMRDEARVAKMRRWDDETRKERRRTRDETRQEKRGEMR